MLFESIQICLPTHYHYAYLRYRKLTYLSRRDRNLEWNGLRMESTIEDSIYCPSDQIFPKLLGTLNGRDIEWNLLLQILFTVPLNRFFRNCSIICYNSTMNYIDQVQFHFGILLANLKRTYVLKLID